VSVENLFLKPAGEWTRLLDLGSSGLLSTQFQPGLLLESGYESWRKERRSSLRDVQALRLTFETRLLPDGSSDKQSGLLLLPAARNGVRQSLTWVIWTRGTDLERTNAPSAYANSESLFAALLASLGFGVWMPDYAGFGVSAGIQTYCVPDSQALSAADGLAAARQVVQGLDRYYQETGNLFVMGYSQGGQAALASARRIQENPRAFPGLSLPRVYALSGPLDLMIGAGPLADDQAVIDRPEYTVYLVLGWARAFPDQVLPAEILKPEILSKAYQLFDGFHKTGAIHDTLLGLVGKPRGGVTYQDLFLPSYLGALKQSPELLPYYRLQKAARLDRWVPGKGTELILAASPTDEVVNPQNSVNARNFIRAQDPLAQVRWVELRSGTHRKSGAEALLYAILDMDVRPVSSP